MGPDWEELKGCLLTLPERYRRPAPPTRGRSCSGLPLLLLGDLLDRMVDGDGQLHDRAVGQLLACLARLRQHQALGALRLLVDDLHLAASGQHLAARLVELLAFDLGHLAELLGALAAGACALATPAAERREG